MGWRNWILAYLFDCVHRHTTWPHRDRTGLDYVCCLDCGKELPYSTYRMSIVSKEEQLEDRNHKTWGEIKNVGGAAFTEKTLRPSWHVREDNLEVQSSV